MSGSSFPIGAAGQAWGDEERATWAARAGVARRSYAEEVLAKLELLKDRFDIVQYGALSQDPARYPLFCIKTRGFDPGNGKPCVLVTGGVHGYETSGVQGALGFAATEMVEYAAHFNVLVCPCVSPWGYECIQRWNVKAVDPNRCFGPHAISPAEEADALSKLVAHMAVPQWAMHMDLHETTNTDNSEFVPAKAARDGVDLEILDIPDGFYLVGDRENPQATWHTAIIDAVRIVTHLAPANACGEIIDCPCTQEGVSVVAALACGLCSGITNAVYATTTEVYPDSETNPMTAQQCVTVQVTAVTAGLAWIVANAGSAGT
jgi:hypothetical protein